MPTTLEHKGLFLSSSTNAAPMVPEDPIMRAEKEFGSSLKVF
jgi:hypothetical protein